MTPRITVVLPVYNGEKWLTDCVQSVLSQTCAELELLIGDDGSTDTSRELTGAIRDTRVRVYRHERNAGLFANLNRLVRESTAPLIHFLCQDDMLEPHCLATEITCFEAHPEVAMSICCVHIVDEDGLIVGEWKVTHEPMILTPEKTLQKLLYEGCIAGNLSTVCARRAALADAGGFDESFRVAGDYEMWVRLGQRGCLADLQQKLVRLREHRRRLSLTPQSGVDFVRENRRIRAQLFPLLRTQIRPHALRFTRWKHNVFDTNHFVRCLVDGRFHDGAALAGIMGAKDLAAGLAAWLLTVNNRLYKPRPGKPEST